MTEERHSEAEGSGLLGRTFVALCLVYFLNSFFITPFSAIFPVYVETDLERLPWFTGYLRGLMLVLGGIFAVVSGRLSDLLGLKITLLLGLGGYMLTGLVFHVADPLLLTLLIFGMGMATGPWSTAGQSYLITGVAARRLGLGGALYFLSNTAGGAVGGLVFGILKTEWSFPAIGTFMSFGLVAVFFLAILLMPGGERRTPVSSDTPFALWSAYLPLLRRRDVHLLIGLRYMITSFWGMATLLMPLLIYRASQSASTAAYYGAVSLAVAAACQLLTGLIRDRYGRTVPLIVSSLGIVISSAFLVLNTDSVSGLFIFGTALTATAWAVSTLVPALIAEVSLDGEKNRLIGLGHMVWSGSMVTGSIVGGILVEVGPHLPFVLGVIHASVGTLCIWRLCTRLDSNAEAGTDGAA